MGNVKRIVCLANSRKRSGRCIAGKEWDGGQPGGWVRPVSDRENQEVSEYERQYEDGRDPRVLDVLNVPVLEHNPQRVQCENWLLDAGFYWEKVDTLRWAELARFVDTVEPLWNGGEHTLHGRNDKISGSTANLPKNSLRLIQVEQFKLSVFKTRTHQGVRRRVQGCFSHAGEDYKIWVTDPQHERMYLAKSDGVHEVGGAFLTISIGDLFEDAYYKLIAAVIPNPQGHAS